MKYKGIKLKEFTSDKPIFFDPPKQMLVWDNDSIKPIADGVRAYLPTEDDYPVVGEDDNWQHCAEIQSANSARRIPNEI